MSERPELTSELKSKDFLDERIAAYLDTGTDRKNFGKGFCRGKENF